MAGAGCRRPTWQNVGVPVVKVYSHPSVTAEQRASIAAALSRAVPRALACAEEPYDGTLKPGDLNLLMSSDLTDLGSLSVVIEVQTRSYRSRAVDRDDRAAVIRRGVEDVYAGSVGVWLVLVTGGWSQSGDGQ
jgi:hypothetical protein